jgi:hypothetical protein
VLSRQENRCVLPYLWYMRYSKDLILLLGVFVMVPRDLTAYQMMRLRWGAPQIPAKSADQAFSLLNLGAHELYRPPKSFVFYIDFGPPWVYACGGQIGSSSFLVKVALSALNRLYFLSLPFSSFWVEVKNSGKPVAPNNLSTSYDLLFWSREMP